MAVLVVTAILQPSRTPGRAQAPPSDGAPAALVQEFVESYCVECHAAEDGAAGLELESFYDRPLSDHRADWEKVVRKLRTRQMPPIEVERPDEETYRRILASLEMQLDTLAAQHPQPGRTSTFRRLTRTEYQNAVRDLLHLDIDATDFFPADEVSHGFDNVTVDELSPTLVNRYVRAARKISRLAVGVSSDSPAGMTFRVRPDVTQEEHVEGLPLGTRGGILISHTFPEDGEYEFRVRLTRDRNEHVEGLRGVHELELLIDSERIRLFQVRPPAQAEPSDDYGQPSHDHVDRHLHARVRVTAGPHEVGVTFLKKPSSLLETQRQPLNVHFNMYRHPRLAPAVYQVSINGPFDSTGAGDTPSRRRIFICRPAGPEDEEACARRILTRLLHRASRGPVDDDDLVNLMALFREGRAEGDFDCGIEMALSGILVHPKFLFRIERDPPGISPGTAYRISDVELASRLSFFLWSSVPDDDLLDLAERGRLSEPDVLEAQTLRILRDDRAQSLATNFAGQWLYLRNLDSITPDGRLYPDFDDNLRQAMRRETELFFESVVREDRSVLDLVQADDTFLDERLAAHYGIPHVYGSRFRRVALSPDSRRGGLLRHASVLTVTSYATRTSPVIRGKWVLENLLGTPPPPPPPGVPALSENQVSTRLPLRERLASHRSDSACAACHNLIDPAGFALENFDAVGRWRDLDNGHPVDASGGLPDGREFTGVAALEQALLDRPEIVVGTLAEKLMTYALGRGCEPYDAPAIRRIVQQAEADQYRFSSLILAIVRSTPFQMRMSE